MNQLFIKRIAYDHSIDTHQSDATQEVCADQHFGAKSSPQFTTLVAQCLALILIRAGLLSVLVWNLLERPPTHRFCTQEPPPQPASRLFLFGQRYVTGVIPAGGKSHYYAWQP